ncbi:outer membrane beta-barrel protein, partial [Candidatus Neomarinimicrobiota bacterium]
MGRLIGAQRIVGGSISRIQSLTTVSVRLIDIESGKVINAIDYDTEQDLEYLLTTGLGEIAVQISDLDPLMRPLARVMRRTTWGMLGGVNYASSDMDIDPYHERSFSQVRVPIVGSVLEVALFQRYSLRAELIWHEKGWQYTYDYWHDDRYWTVVNTSLSNSMDVRLFLRRDFGRRVFKVYGLAGLDAGYRFDTEILVEGSPRHGTYRRSLRDVNKLDFGVGIGAGISARLGEISFFAEGK